MKSVRTVNALGQNEVLVRILCTGVCHTDFMAFGRPGAVPGHEAVGIVEAAGSAVSDIAIGDRVGMGYICGSCGSCRECDDGYEQLCDESEKFWSRPNGGYASHVTWDARYVHPIPDAIPSAHAGPLLCAGATMYAAIADARIEPGGTVGVLGIGGLGHLGLMFADAMGYEAVALTRSPGKEAFTKELGASRTVVTSDPVAMRRSRRSIDLLISTVPTSPDWPTYLELIRPRGHATIVGITGRPHVIPGYPLISANRSVGGNLVGGSKRMKEMLDLAAEKSIKPMIECYPLTPEGAEKAVEAVAHNTVRFRAVLVAEGCDGQ